MVTIRQFYRNYAVRQGVRLTAALAVWLAAAGTAPAFQAVHPVSGRKIAQVMGAGGADWLERNERESEEHPDAALDATLGPAIARLRQTYPDTEAYLDFWRAHPALAEHWTSDVEAYARYDLIGEEGHLRSRAAEDAVRADARDVLAEKPFADALSRLTRPTPLLTAPTGFFGVPPPLLPPEVVAAWQDRVPALRPQTVPGANHYTILFEREAAAAVSQAIRAAAL